MKNAKFYLTLICLCLLIHNPSAFAQNSECEIYQLMSTYLKKNENKKLSSYYNYYIWSEKERIEKPHLKYLKEKGTPDNLLMWDSLEPIAIKNKKLNKCKLDIGFAYRFTNKEKIWSKVHSGEVRLVVFSEILYYNEKQAFAFVVLRYHAGVSLTYYFFFERENEKWKIRKVVDFFRV